MPVRIAIIGGGVNGLATGLKLQHALPDVSVHIIADKLGDETTSRGAGGLWKPHVLGDTPDADVNRWGEATFKHMLGLLQSPASAAAGMQLVDAYQLWDKPVDLPLWRDIVPSFQTLNATELTLFPGVSCTHGWKYTTIVCDSQLYMRHLHGQFEQAGGKIERRNVQSISELADYDLVMNCAGLASKQLFPDDNLTAVRGQVMRVRAPWVKHYINFNGQNYIIPNFDTVVLGGTTQRGNFDTTISQKDKQHILEGCCKLVPSLRHAEVVSNWAGLRPARDRVLISLDKHKVTTPGGASKMLPVVHNYGHGGAGITLHWGCAEDAVALAKEYFAQQHLSKL